jgi:hypothetical protein
MRPVDAVLMPQAPQGGALQRFMGAIGKTKRVRGTRDIPDVVEKAMLAALEQELTGSVVEQKRDSQMPMTVSGVGQVTSDVLPGESSVVLARHEHLVVRPLIVHERHCERFSVLLMCPAAVA